MNYPLRWGRKKIIKFIKPTSNNHDEASRVRDQELLISAAFAGEISPSFLNHNVQPKEDSPSCNDNIISPHVPSPMDRIGRRDTWNSWNSHSEFDDTSSATHVPKLEPSENRRLTRSLAREAPCSPEHVCRDFPHPGNEKSAQLERLKSLNSGSNGKSLLAIKNCGPLSRECRILHQDFLQDHIQVPKLHISLSYAEKASDFAAFGQSKFSVRPNRRRPRTVEQIIQQLTPGLCLSEVSMARYAVKEKPCNGGGGIRAMAIRDGVRRKLN